MIDKLVNTLLGLFFIFIGFEVLIIQKFQWRGGIVDFTDPTLRWPISFTIIGFGLYIIILTFLKLKDKETND